MSDGVIWISRDQIYARLKEAKWRHSTQTQRVEILRQTGTGKIMNLPKKDYFPESAVWGILKSAGLTRPEIEDFLKKAVKK